ncbi:LacI family DNA-binding transcriptional regulator [Leifsonia sp. fls2-241-R2A-40a]|uniref:LacI family DNA-binding transcriptional regulator n=1 Tax=Leifsonia sp. fls2-241-R2A-40a TaxID=3040290 RepID=UPI00254FD4A7|nr:LacI family DNA-binding transcriptional regulator [Leifsonia sp. fls2-241-R2A-40a]
MESPNAQPTIRTVAARAGVSKSLVSLVLQGSPKVSPERRAAVEAAMADLGYQPSLVAQSLSARRTGVFGVVMNDLRNPWFVNCLEGFAGAAGKAGYRTVLADERLDDAGGGLVESVLRLHVDGLVLMGTMDPSAVLRDAARRRPTVVAASRDFAGAGLDVVANDDVVGTRLALTHLWELGHRRIAHIDGGRGAIPAIRRDTFRGFLAERGVHDPAVEAGGTTEGDGYAAALRLLAMEQRPTAIFAFNDVVATGVLAAAGESGFTVPRDLSVVGYDNTSLAAMRLVNLTSVDNASTAVGATAAEALVRRLEEPEADGRLTLVEPTLVVRATTAPLP